MKMKVKSIKKNGKNEVYLGTFKNGKFEVKVVKLREIPREEAKKEIIDLFESGRILYYSSIAEELRLDLELIVEICDELIKEGHIEVVE